MSFPPGRYLIRSAINPEPFVARKESPEPGPQPVIILPTGTEPQEWKIVPVNEAVNLNLLFVKDWPTTTIDGKVFAIDVPGPLPREWNIEKLPQHGDNQYLIQLFQVGGPIQGWVLRSEEPFTQVEIGVLTPTKSLPPQYPATQRWIIEGPFDN